MRHLLACCLSLLLLAVAPLSANSQQERTAPKELLVQRVGQPSQTLTRDRIVALPAITQRVGFATGHGEQVNEWTGPLLWDVLAAAGAIDPARAGEAVHLVVRITGGDGYKAVVAMGEISPQFAGRPIQVAYRLNGAPVPDQDLRLVVPGDRRGGRSVRGVVRIDVE